MIDRSIDQIDATDQVVLVVELFDKVTQPFRRVRSQMKHKIEFAIGEHPLDQIFISHATPDKPCSFVDVVQKPTTKVVDNLDCMAPVE